MLQLFCVGNCMSVRMDFRTIPGRTFARQTISLRLAQRQFLTETISCQKIHRAASKTFPRLGDNFSAEQFFDKKFPTETIPYRDSETLLR